MIPANTFKELETTRDQALAREQRTHLHVTAAEFRRHILEVSRIVTVFCHLVIAFVAIGMALDLHAARQEMAAFRDGLFVRLDNFGWKMDTEAENSGALAKTLRDALVKMRAQVHESTQASAQTAQATNVIAAQSVKQSASTAQLVEQVSAQPEAVKPPVVNIQVPKAAAPVVSVQPAAPTAPSPPATQPAQRTRARRRWFQFWAWGRHHAGTSE